MPHLIARVQGERDDHDRLVAAYHERRRKELAAWAGRSEDPTPPKRMCFHEKCYAGHEDLVEELVSADGDVHWYCNVHAEYHRKDRERAVARNTIISRRVLTPE